MMEDSNIITDWSLVFTLNLIDNLQEVENEILAISSDLTIISSSQTYFEISLMI